MFYGAFKRNEFLQLAYLCTTRERKINYSNITYFFVRSKFFILFHNSTTFEALVQCIRCRLPFSRRQAAAFFFAVASAGVPAFEFVRVVLRQLDYHLTCGLYNHRTLIRKLSRQGRSKQAKHLHSEWRYIRTLPLLPRWRNLLLLSQHPR